MIPRKIRSAPGITEYGSDGYNVPEATQDVTEANIITSEFDGESDYLFADQETFHAPVLDLDFPATLIPSSTPGHYHLYLDTLLSEEKYFALLDALAEAGILEEGYVAASKDRGYTAVRLPWIRK